MLLSVAGGEPFRLASMEDPSSPPSHQPPHPTEYIPMLREAYRLWSVLEKESKQTLFTQTGYLDISPPSDASHGGYSLCERSAASARRYGLQHEVLTAAETMHRFPALQLPSHYTVHRGGEHWGWVCWACHYK